MGSIQGDEQCRVFVFTAVQILLKMNLGFRIKVYPPLFITLSIDDAFPLLEIDVGNIEIDQLADPNSRGVEHVDHGNIPDLCAIVPHHLNGLIRNDFFDHCFRFDFMDAPHRAFQNIILLVL